MDAAAGPTIYQLILEGCFPTHIIPSLRMFYIFLSAIYYVQSTVMCAQSVVD